MNKNLDSYVFDWELTKNGNQYTTGLKVRNSLSNSIVEFIPQQGKRVTWYACGPTTYDSAHLGHARNYISTDIIRRIMTDYLGYEVEFCMNITNIDDKIIQRSNELNVDFDQLAKFYENEFFADLELLNCMPPLVLTRVSEYIVEIIDYIQKIISNGYAYYSNGSVYFDIEKFKSSNNHIYARMEPWSANTEARVLEGEGALSLQEARCDKKNNLDFALWKKVKEGEPSWDSPWGQGRPGWHIECSVMASSIFGHTIDIHSGGIDLRFPHHDNELAQSEAYYNKPNWVKYFLHCGHLHIEGLKMSKSLKNFISIKAIIKQYNYKIIRLLFLLHKWDQPMNYVHSEETMEEPKQYDNMFTYFIVNMKKAIEQNYKLFEFNEIHDVDTNSLEGRLVYQKWETIDNNLAIDFQTTKKLVHTNICNNFDTPAVLVNLKNLINSTNSYYKLRQNKCKIYLLYQITSYINRILSIFGLSKTDTMYSYIETYNKDNTDRFTTSIDYLCEFRAYVRKNIIELIKNKQVDTKDTLNKILSYCDDIRDKQLPKIDIKLNDVGTADYTWHNSCN